MSAMTASRYLLTVKIYVNHIKHLNKISFLIAFGVSAIITIITVFVKSGPIKYVFQERKLWVFFLCYGTGMGQLPY